MELIVECREGISLECNVGGRGCCELHHIAKNERVTTKAICLF
jgi:hypothetical protein